MARIQITEANLKNGTINLSKIKFFFPKECIGGGNKYEMGKEMKICYHSNEKFYSFDTDIATGNKAVFRKRGVDGTKGLLINLDIEAGDILEFRKLGDYHFEALKTF